MAKKKNTSSNDKNFLIVGIGGSAGAIEAVIEIVEHLTSHTGMAYIYLQHQSPDFESKMAQVLSKKSKIPVLEVEDKMPIEPDFFYVIPPGKEASLVDGEIQLSKQAEYSDHCRLTVFLCRWPTTIKSLRLELFFPVQMVMAPRD
jgi:two-component system CheB/CheR fusion protein